MGRLPVVHCCFYHNKSKETFTGNSWDNTFQNMYTKRLFVFLVYSIKSELRVWCKKIKICYCYHVDHIQHMCLAFIEILFFAFKDMS